MPEERLHEPNHHGLDRFGFDFSAVERTFNAKILSYEETLARIAQPGVSMARFGDGEIKQLVRSYNIGFQPFNMELQRNLREVVRTPHPNVLVGFPPVFRNEQWAKLWIDVFEEVADLFSHTSVLANTAVSRPPCFNELRQRAVVLWRKVWEGKTVCVITGEGSRFDLYPELFGNAKKVDIVRTLPVDAYSDLPRLMDVVASAPRYDKYLLSLGSAATILAHRLAAQGLDALDIGHLSGSYSYVMEKGLYPEKMPLTR